MKKSEALLKLQRLYHIRHCMVESGHITPEQFMAEVLGYIEHELKMAPPFCDAIFQKNAKIYIDPSGREWEPE